MTREEFKELVKNGPVILDGATGSNLQNAGMPVMNFTADPTNANMMEAGAQKVTKSIKSGMAENQAATKKSEDILDEEPEDNEFLDFSFGM